MLHLCQAGVNEPYVLKFLQFLLSKKSERGQKPIVYDGLVLVTTSCKAAVCGGVKTFSQMDDCLSIHLLTSSNILFITFT